jgi:ligand-binding sensor domain-containing protein
MRIRFTLGLVFVLAFVLASGASAQNTPETMVSFPHIAVGQSGEFTDVAPTRISFSVDGNGSVGGGPPGGVVLSMVTDAAGNIYAGTLGGVYRKAKQTSTWTAFNAGLTNLAVTSLIADAAGNIYAGTIFGGVFKSPVSAPNWIAMNSGLPASTNLLITPLTLSPVITVGALAIDAGGNLYAGTGFVFGGGSGVYKSANGGLSWKAFNSGGIDTFSITSLALDSSGHLYAGALDKGIFKSSAQFAEWSPVNNGFPDSAAVMAITFDSQGNIYAGSGTVFEGGYGVFKSIDGGNSWTDFNSDATSSQSITSLAADSSGFIYAGVAGGIFKTAASAPNWTSFNSGLPLNSTVLALTRDSAGNLYAGTYGGVFITSAVPAANWSSLNSGLNAQTVLAVAADPVIPGTVYAGTPAGVFKSTDGGTTWAAANTGLTNLVVSSFAFDSKHNIYAGTGSGIGVLTGVFVEGSGVFKSTDGGASWSSFNSVGLESPFIMALAVDAADNIYTATLGGGIAKSSRDVANWTASNTGLDVNAIITSLVFDSAGNLYAGGDTIFKSTNQGLSWAVFSSSAITNTPIMSLLTDNSGNIFAGTLGGAGIYKSPTAAASWAPSSIGLTIPAVSALTMDVNGNIYAAIGNPFLVASGGVYKSTNGGLIWSAINSGFTIQPTYVFSLTVDQTASGNAFAGTVGGGVFKANAASPVPTWTPAGR